MYAHASLAARAPVIRQTDSSRHTPWQFYALIAATLLVGVAAIGNPVAREPAAVGTTVTLVGP